MRRTTKLILLFVFLCCTWIGVYKLAPRIRSQFSNAIARFNRYQVVKSYDGVVCTSRSGEKTWIDGNKPLLWAHAGGAKLGVYSNSKEAIDDAIESGFKVIEIDVSITSDGVLVLSHDFRPNAEWIYSSTSPSLKEFKSRKINDNLTPLTWDEFVEEYSKRDEDVWFVIDPKENLLERFNFVDYAKTSIPRAFLKRLSYSIYGTKELCKFKDGPSPFGSLHYCLDYFGRDGRSCDGQRFEDIVALLPVWLKLGVQSVSFGDKNERSQGLKNIVKMLRDNGIVVSVFGVNSEANYLSWKKFGVNCINTDYLYPARTESGVQNITILEK